MREDAQHYFFECNKYLKIRENMIKRIGNILTLRRIELNLLTNGSNEFTYQQNCFLFNEVFKYIKSYERFLDS